MSKQTKQMTSDPIDANDTFAYHEIADLEAMTLQDVEQIWDLVPTEDRDYLTRRYRKSVKAHGISSDEQEIQMVDQYLQRYIYEGLVPAGDQWVRMSATRRQQLKSGQTDVAEIDEDEKGGLPWTNIAVLVFVVFLIIFVGSRVLGGNTNETVVLAGTSTLTPTLTATFTPSPTPTITPTSTATPIALMASDSFIAAGDGRNRDWFPVQIQVRRPDEDQPRVFIVQERAIELTEWSFDANPDVASWISGTLVRPVFGIPFSDSNQDFLQSLIPGTEFSIRMNTGSELHYIFSSAQELGRENTSLLRQDQPGIVMVLIGEIGSDGLPTSSRYFITGTYNPNSEVNLSTTGILPLGVGEQVHFSDLSLQVEASYALPVPDDVSDEFMYAVIDVTLTASDNDVLLTNYQWFLDTDTARYSPDLAPLSGTTYANIPAMIPAGEAIQASLQFLVNRIDGQALFLIAPPGVVGESFVVNLTQPNTASSVDYLDVQLRAIRRSNSQIYVDVRIYNPQSDAVILQPEDMGMIFGFVPMPTGATQSPIAYEPLSFEPDYALDVTLTWDWNGDDPFARLDLAGRVWSITLLNE